jgi:hypothetical protein
LVALTVAPHQDVVAQMRKQMAKHDQGGQHSSQVLGQRLCQGSQLFILALLELLHRSDIFL